MLLKSKWTHVLPLSILLVGGINVSCSDSVDTSAMYTFTGQTITDYIAKDSDFTMFYQIVKKSKVSDQTESTLDALLSARGNYTCFIPDNKAVKNFLDSIYEHKPYVLDTMSEATANKITQNCIIDNGDEDAFKTSDLSVGAITQGTLNDRHILVTFDTLSGGKFTVILNGNSHITTPDIKLENGMVHIVDKVISPSNSTLTSLLSEVGNMKIFSHLLEVTGWGDSMLLYRDEVYESKTDAEVCPYYYASSTKSYKRPPHRYYGYMAFIEPDSVYNKEWGVPMPNIVNGKVTNWSDIMSVIEEKCKAVYTSANSNTLISEENPVNQFVSYHLVGYRVPYNQLVRHMSEYGYNCALPDQLSLNVWEYYKTMGWPYRMFKLTQTAKDGVYHLNRHSYYDNSFFGSYKETSCDHEGITVHDNNGVYTNNALNGYYYPIDNILLYDDYVTNTVLNERIRYNLAANFPEMMSNNIRESFKSHPAYYVPTRYQYVSTMWGTSTDVEYKVMQTNGGSGWQGIQGDQYAFIGLYNITFELMPVPFDGTYEVRYGVSNLPERGLCQGYFGSDRNNMQATGLPFDLRINGTEKSIGSILDPTLGNDSLLCIENDLQMRNHNYMKAPKYYCYNYLTGTNTTTLRSRDRSLRLIIYRGPMKANTKYYVRFKSCLSNPTAYLFGTYFEIVPKSIWNNSFRNEDPW